MKRSGGRHLRPLIMAGLLILSGCENFNFYSLLGNKIDPLVISPPSVSLNVNGGVTFVAHGGVPPYVFSITAAGSGSPAVDPSSGLYTAGSTVGTVDVIQVQDASAATSSATVNVISAVTNVDYDVSASTFPANAVGGTAISGCDFTIRNHGTAAGTRQISWWVFLSASATLTSGATVLAQGTSTQLGAGITATITPTGNWPLAVGTQYAYVMISAGDDLNPGDNIYSGPSIAFTASAPDYTVATVNITGGGTSVGGPVTGSFTLQNSGSAQAGSQPVSWTAFASIDGTLGSDDTFVASGITGPLAAGASSAPIAVNGSWPLRFGNYCLMVTVSAADETATANNTNFSVSQAVGIFDESAGLHDDILALSNPFDTGVTLQPGMSIQVTGTLTGSESDDVIAFNTGTAIGITFSMVWIGAQNVMLRSMTAANVFQGTASVTGGTSAILVWQGPPLATQQWIDINNSSLVNVGNYALTISAN